MQNQLGVRPVLCAFCKEEEHGAQAREEKLQPRGVLLAQGEQP